ncbi:four helix bundle protein [Candidatus Roizmanbacteria bacterium]|jgi:four helix bundle protein|nr:four helix bundle protein [Candidatus Roizmanbacteria bacterium]
MQNLNLKFKSDLKFRCYLFSLELIKFIDKLPKQRSVWIISDQLLRSGTSIGANLVEASSASSRLEFKKYHEISLKSSNETKYWLGLLRDSFKSDKNDANRLLKEVCELSNMIASGILRLKGKI